MLTGRPMFRFSFQARPKGTGFKHPALAEGGLNGRMQLLYVPAWCEQQQERYEYIFLDI